MLKNAIYLSYDVNQYPFTKILEKEVFRVSCLEQLHLFWKKYKLREYRVSELTYKDNLCLRRLMQNLDDNSNFYKVYHSFVRNVIAPKFGMKISYSNHPKMRVHLAGTESVSKWHRDIDITGRADQINVFLPFTDCFDENSLWCESAYGLKDYKPLKVNNGNALLFDGGYLTHGTVANSTNVTRVSLDFRFAPLRRDFYGPYSMILSGRTQVKG